MIAHVKLGFQIEIVFITHLSLDLIILVSFERIKALQPDHDVSKKVLIVVPAYNEEATICQVIDELINTNKEWDILVVDDCSTDNTADLAYKSKNAFVVKLPINLGIGGAVQTGFKYALQNYYDIVVQFDGDGQHIASEVSKIVQPIICGEADVVIGSRFCKEHDGWKSTMLRRFGIKLFEYVNFILINKKITDNTSGFRAYGRSAIVYLANNYPRDYPEPEAVIILGRNGFRILEVFTIMRKRIAGCSSIHGFYSAYYMIKVLLAIFMSAMRPSIRQGE